MNSLHDMGDVKELIPEFFYLPEFLRNSENFDFGLKQSGEKIDNVVLPPWAKTPEEFIYKHRQALESEYVSNNLHNWIDLIFGYKQRGQDAIDAVNVFHHLTYEGTVDVDNIEDPVEKTSVLAQIANFGQTPYQIFKKPHPSRNDILLTIKEPKFNLFNGSSFRKLTTETISDVAIGPIYFMKGIQLGSNSYSLITIDELRQYRKILVKFKNLNLQTEKEREGIDKQRLNIPFRLSPNMFKISNDGKALFSAGHWDNSFKITSLDQNISNEQSVLEHKSRVTCVSLTENVLVTGSVDTSILVWKIVGKKKFKL